MSGINVKGKYIRTSEGYLGKIDKERLCKNQYEFHIDTNQGSIVEDDLRWNSYEEIINGIGPSNNIFRLLISGDIVILRFFDGEIYREETAIVKRKNTGSEELTYFDTESDYLFICSDYKNIEYCGKLGVYSDEKHADLNKLVGGLPNIKPKITRILTRQLAFKGGIDI